MSVFGAWIQGNLDPRSVNDIFLSMTMLGTSPWWIGIGQSLDRVASEFILYGSAALMAARLGGLVMGWWRGRAQKPDADEE